MYYVQFILKYKFLQFHNKKNCTVHVCSINARTSHSGLGLSGKPLKKKTHLTHNLMGGVE